MSVIPLPPSFEKTAPSSQGSAAKLQKPWKSLGIRRKGKPGHGGQWLSFFFLIHWLLKIHWAEGTLFLSDCAVSSVYCPDV